MSHRTPSSATGSTTVMVRYNRKTAPKVRGGKVQRKNRTDKSRHYWHVEQDRPFIDRLDPGKGYRHVLMKRDIERFVGILPDWTELSRDLHAIILDAGDPYCLGWHRPGIVALCAWEKELWTLWTRGFVEEHRPILDRLDVPCEAAPDDQVRVRWTQETVRGFQLMHILLHELGHHHDRMTTRYRHRACRGEPYAERYALDYADRLWDRYFAEFGW